MVKGFAASHVGDYNTAANVTYSVGEYWDGNANTVKAWIDATGKRSAAFDFAFRYAVVMLSIRIIGVCLTNRELRESML